MDVLKRNFQRGVEVCKLYRLLTVIDVSVHQRGCSDTDIGESIVGMVDGSRISSSM